MRSFLAGIFLFSALATCFAPSATGQVEGQVLRLGFGSMFRPDCWTPLQVQLKNRQNDAKNYMIKVHQQDLDKDTVVYTRVVPLGPNATTDFWVYFVPQPTNGGLTAPGRPLAEVLKVYLYDESGKTLLAPLPVNFTVGDIDASQGVMSRGRGKKLVLAVTQSDNPRFDEYAGALGLIEGVECVPVKVEELPGSALGLQSVDAIAWFDAEAREISSGGTGAFEAIQQYVKEGGQLVICQPGERGRIAAFADAGMLPVEAKDAAGAWLNDFKPEPKPDLQPLYDLAVNPGLQERTTQHPNWAWTDRNWDRVRGGNKAFEIYRAKAKPDAVVDMTVHWGDAKDGTPDESPYIARRAYGIGSVVWVAQDLGSHALTTVRKTAPDPSDPQSHGSVGTGGWPYVWDKVFGWNNQTIIAQDWTRGENLRILHPEYREDNAPAVELGRALASGMEASARGAWLVTVAVFFFIVYWIVAGPGSYFFLAQRKKKGLSWTVFAAAALVATAVTVGVVKLVLRGDPEVHHITILQLAPDAPAADGSPRFAATASSRFGLYIPRDGVQTVELTGASDKEPSYVMPLAPYSGQIKADEAGGFTDTQQYAIATDAFTSGDVSVGFPYRSTLKKVQARWVGTTAEGITGAAELVEPFSVRDPKDPNRRITHGPLKGTIVNNTGRDLRDVYIAYHVSAHVTGTVPYDNLLYVRSWTNGAPIDLDAEDHGAVPVNSPYNPGNSSNSTQTYTPDFADPAGRSLKGILSTENGGWYDYWVRGLPKATAMGSGDVVDDSTTHYVRSLPLMAFFDRVAPYKGQVAANDPEPYRADILRHGGRALNVSQLVAAGRLVIVAQAEGAVPFPLKVDGSPVGGEGVTIYEASLPLQDKLGRPATRPASGPTTGPATGPSVVAPVATAAPVAPVATASTAAVGASVPGR